MSSELAGSLEGKTITVNGMEMYYEQYGKGEPLLLLHGMHSNGKMWHSFIEKYAKHFSLIIPDYRGHGRSNNPSSTFKHRQASQDLFALLDHLEIEEFNVMGRSSGGMIALHLATQRPERVKSMVLASATPYFPQSARNQMAQSDPEKMELQDWEYFRGIYQLGDEQIRAMFSHFCAFAQDYEDMNFTSPYLSTIQARTLILHGDRDSLFPLSIPVEMYQSIPESELWILPETGHATWNDESRERIAQGILDFLLKRKEDE